jgi:predicted SAM-dependent methyltransferase
MEALRVNVGCGPSAIPGWANLDNSPSLVLARLPEAGTALLERVGVIGAAQARMVEVGRTGAVKRGRADALPFADDTVSVVYSSHMLEHLGRDEARAFLGECRRILRPSGVLRLVVPDLDHYVRAYVEDGDADSLVENLHMTQPAAEASALRRLLVGFRGHRWMYDSRSLKDLVEAAGFEDVECLAPGETRLEDPAGLDLREREEDSIYLEARKGRSGSGVRASNA